MANTPLSFKNDDQVDDRLNPTELAEKEYLAGQDTSGYTNAGIDQAEAHANDPANASQENIKEQEENPMNYTSGGSEKQTQARTITGFFRKRGASIGIISLLTIGGFGLTGLFGPATMLINIAENFSISNDSSSTAMERRFMKVFGFATQTEDPICKNNSKKMKCKMGRISNSALKKLEKKGVKGCFDGDCTSTNSRRLGYPEKNPSHYLIDLNDGSTPKKISAKDLPGFLAQKENRKIAGKILGTSGAFNLRYKAWVGKHISDKLYKKFGLKRNGGLTDGEDTKRGSLSERLQLIRERLTSASRPDESKISSAEDALKTKLDKKLKHAKKGGPVYLGLYAGCTVPKIPQYVAAAAAAIQLAQILPVVMDTVLSPAGKNKATGVQNNFTGEDAEVIGTLLTEETPRESDDKKTSALDSPYLLAAMGANKAKPAVSEDFTPGYGVLKKALPSKKKVDGLTESKGCDAITSPQAMYAAMAADGAATLAASATIVGGIAKFAASWLISAIVTKMVVEAGGAILGGALREMVDNDKIATAKGEALGDVLGIGALAFFSSGGMARHLPTLKKSQLVAWDRVKKENEEFQREVDIASLSPFDTSSRYTFMGSIVHNTQMAMISDGSMSSFGSLLSRAIQVPAYVLSPNASAVMNYTENSCGYAKEFDIEIDTAINAAGMPCTGLTPEQTDMSTKEAIDLMVAEGWLDEAKDIPENATIEELMESGDDGKYEGGSGYIKKETPLWDFIDQCSNPETGDYLFNSGSCKIEEPSSDPRNAEFGSQRCYPDESSSDPEAEICSGSGGSDFNGESEVEGVKNPRSILAIPVFLLDFQIHQSMNGEDEEEDKQTTPKGGASGSVMSWNVRGADKDGLLWSVRKTHVINVIKEKAPDIIGLQEMNEDVQHKDLKAALPDYGLVGGEGEANKRPILWNNSVYEKLDSGIYKHQRYSDSEKQPAPWVKLKNKTNGSELFVFNYHGIAHDSNAEKKRKGAKDLVEAINDIAGISTPVIITGDFNSKTGQFADPIIKAAGFIDTFQAAETKINGEYNTHGDIGKPPKKEGQHIDHIYMRPATAVPHWELIINDDTLNASDHLPIFVTFGSESSESGSGASGDVQFPVDKKYWESSPGIFKKPHFSCGSFTTGGCIDIGLPVPKGAKVYAIAGGTITKRPLGRSGIQCTGDPNSNNNGGLMIESKIGGGTLLTAYAHGYEVTTKSTVVAGDYIMKLGQVGNACGAHLHIDMTFNGKPICPQDVFIAIGSGQTPNFSELTTKTIGSCGR